MYIVGQDLETLDTPVLWVDLDRLEKNILILANYMKEAGVNWRPHTKGIKIPAIAHMLLDAGAIGVTCAKLSEVEVMAAAGIKDILVGNQIVGATKIKHLCALRHYSDIMVAVAELENAIEISKFAVEAGMRIRVLAELNIGMNRAGVAPGRPAVELACRMAELPGLQLSGLMGWEGHVVSIEDPSKKKAETEKSINALVDSASQCREAGLPIQIVSCGGSGSFRISANVPGITEIQAGGGIFGDVTYRKWGAGTEPALFVQALVTSRPTLERAIIDAGRKTMNGEVSMPEVVGFPSARLTGLSAEHGYLQLSDPDLQIKAGDLLELLVGYGDWTVCLHDQLVGVRNGKVEVVWDVQGRGKLI